VKFKRWHKIGLGFAAVTVALGLAALSFPQRVLTVDNGPVKADALVVLGGGQGERAIRAAELFKAGDASKIIVSGAGDGLEVQRVLIRNGVPASAIQLESSSQSTRQNAQFTGPLLRAMGAKTVIIVTSWYHSRRGLKCFRHYAPDIQFYSRPAYSDYSSSGWARHWTGRYIRFEYLKLAGYWVCYGVFPV
jgi:uncharacterized SAM-binding protein YcdF (DUF218 family)